MAKIVGNALPMVTVDCATLGIYLVVLRIAGGELSWRRKKIMAMNKLIEAAQAIKDACNPANCNDCPLTDEAGRCVVKDWIDDMCPCKWRVEEIKHERDDK